MIGVGAAGPIGAWATSADGSVAPVPGRVTPAPAALHGRGPARLTERQAWAVLTWVDGLGPVGFGALCTAHQSSHARDELIRAERLGQVIVGAEVEAHDAVRFLGPRGDDDDGQIGGRPVAAQHPAQLESAHTRQHHVENGQIDLMFPDIREGVAG